jgi:CHASE3 domain sensor protein
MLLNVKISIISALSDVQETLSSPREQENNRMRINFAKMLVMKLSQGVTEMTEEEIEALSDECRKKFGK